MSYGDPTTAPTPVAGPPTSTAPTGAPAGSAPSFPSAPPTAMPLAPPTTPGAPSGFPATPPTYTGPLPGGAGGGWNPPGGAQPSPTPSSGRGPGAGRKVAIGLLLVLALLAGVAGGFGLSQLSGSTDDTASPRQREVPTEPNGSPFGGEPSQLPTPGQGQGGSNGQSGSGDTADADAVAQKVVPGVVNINVLSAQGQGAGTGITLSSDGLVVTNNHVIRGATRIVVTDADTGERYEAKVVGTAKTKDLAVIQLQDAEGLDTVKIGDSDSVEVGDAVVALGNAGGQGGTPSVVTGNVVALGRSITASDESGSQAQRLNDLIQIDANIVPGDSGGPLANADGEVIGINAAASSTNEVSSNDEGYAIPINAAMDIVEQIKAGKESDVVRIGARGVLGVSVASVADDPFGQGQGGATSGASVAAVADGSGAAEAGVTQGSTITAVDGTTIDSAEALTSALDGAKPGDEVELSWTDANGQSRTATVTLTEGPPD
ncbi:S1C family serine protease [Dermatobacter hominis]|uniref:S1C family serine protease n=1 Tax=Dermatobacter hominis TaxID=2884263 RepID=UPI001D126F9A|nr:trypsin-like peptidase domain-containing protein [Dermatobacter hominis]UDY34710.1 trypsin-like peptidase domain-containing protein [Dermatobacter hominis]